MFIHYLYCMIVLKLENKRRLTCKVNLNWISTKHQGPLGITCKQLNTSDIDEKYIIILSKINILYLTK